MPMNDGGYRNSPLMQKYTPPPSPGIGQGGLPNRDGVPGMVSGPAFSVTGNPNTAPQPGLGAGVPNPTMYEDYSMGYPNGQGDPLLMLLMALLERRHPNGM